MGNVLFLFLLLVLVVLYQYPVPVRSQTSTQAKNLRTQLFITNGYDKKVRPQLDQSETTDVYVSFYLLAVNELDAKSETLKTTGFLTVEWLDQHLAWNNSDYGGISVSFWPQDDVWKPDVALKNSFKEYKELGISALNVQVSENGQVLWAPFQVFQSTCAIDVKYFPFDVQTCFLRFVAWSYTKEQVLMYGGPKGIELSSYSPNSAWDIKDSSWSVEWESGEASIKFILELKRKPMFIILNTLLPIMMLAVLNLFVFVLPCESGEKAGYAVTVFLAFAVFMTIISSTLPENSDTTSIFSVYVVLLTLQSTLITVIALWMIRMGCSGEDKKVPKLLAFLSNLTHCKMCRTKVNDFPKDDTSINEVKNINLKTFDTDDIAENDKEQENTVTWVEAMRALDTIFLVLFTTVFVMASLICLLAASRNI